MIITNYIYECCDRRCCRGSEFTCNIAITISRAVLPHGACISIDCCKIVLVSFYWHFFLTHRRYSTYVSSCSIHVNGNDDVIYRHDSTIHPKKMWVTRIRHKWWTYFPIEFFSKPYQSLWKHVDKYQYLKLCPVGFSRSFSDLTVSKHGFLLFF